MTGDELRKLRERRGLDRNELAELMNSALGTTYSGESIARWERGREPARKVQAFLDELAVQEFSTLTGAAGGDDELELDGGFAPNVDEPPGPGAPAAQPVLVSGSGAMVKACTELWELIATGVGMVGAAVGSEALMNDGAIIAGDKEALGAAWGKLAETNDTFRRMLVGMTEGGAWLQVALVTGTTFSKCWQSHGAYAAHYADLRQRAATDDGSADLAAA